VHYEVPHYAVFFTLLLLHPLGSKYSSLRTLFSNTLKQCSSLKVTDQISHPYKTTGKVIGLYILIRMFLDNRQEDENSELEGSKPFPNLLF
jgi:hypothetical protein